MKKLDDGVRNIQVVGPDVLLAGGMVVVDQRNAFLRIGFLLKFDPSRNSFHDALNAAADRHKRRDGRARLWIDAALNFGSYRNGLDHALQLRHGDLIVNTGPGQPVGREQPLIGTALGYPHRSKDGKPQLLKKIAHLFASLIATQDEALHGDDSADIPRLTFRFNNISQSGFGGCPPAGEYRQRVHSSRIQVSGQSVLELYIPRMVVAVVVDNRDRGPAWFDVRGKGRRIGID